MASRLRAFLLRGGLMNGHCLPRGTRCRFNESPTLLVTQRCRKESRVELEVMKWLFPRCTHLNNGFLPASISSPRGLMNGHCLPREHDAGLANLPCY
ncbi:hypothetical protein CEXT_583431 [Caerostris extrusa]|uniref:Secreted protein n=1 Tax=Caerostris extrusa TaxID=172846 RepID=A0AAV4WKI7_CAEEX|nr:hypothetical protein CEXT_583431 [Caerostris extrusa]